MRRVSPLFVLVGLLVAAPAGAQAPPTVPVQGELTDPDGQPIDDEVTITARLFASAMGGTELFVETQSVRVRNGAFTFFLGNTASLDLSLFRDGEPLFVELVIDGEVMSPRLALGSVPYAALADHSDDAARLGGMPPEAYASAVHSHEWSDVTVDPSEVQSRVAEECPEGSSIRAIAEDGTVTCEPDDAYSMGDLDVSGTLRADALSGESLVYRQCGGRYLCTPRECLQTCIDNGERMAFVDEVYAWASQGSDHCSYLWMLDRNNLDQPVRGYPMYSNRTTSGCGRTGTGEMPRIEGFSAAYDWDATTEYDCACARIR